MYLYDLFMFLLDLMLLPLFIYLLSLSELFVFSLLLSRRWCTNKSNDGSFKR